MARCWDENVKSGLPLAAKKKMGVTLPDKPNLTMSCAVFYLLVTDMLNLLHYIFPK